MRTLAPEEKPIFRDRAKHRRCSFRTVFSEEELSQLARFNFMILAAERLPDQFNVNLRLPHCNAFRNLPCNGGKFTFGCEAMYDHDPVAVNTEIASPRIDDMQPVAFLFPHITDAKIIGVEKFDDTALK